jgi:hypothetical protein
MFARMGALRVHRFVSSPRYPTNIVYSISDTGANNGPDFFAFRIHANSGCGMRDASHSARSTNI